MKITHVIPAMTKGGGERVMVTLANAAHRAGHEVTVVAAFPVDPAVLQSDLLPGIDVRFLSDSGNWRFRRYVDMLPWLVRNWGWLREQDVLHVHLTFAALVGTAVQWLRRLAGGAKPRVVETYHAVGMPIKTWQHLLASALAPGRDGLALMAEDPVWLDFARRHPELPIAIIPNGIELPPQVSREEIASWRQSVGIDPGAQLIGNVGRLVVDRAPFKMVAAFARIAQFLPEARFAMVGEGPMREAVLAEGARLGIGDRLHLPGAMLRPFTAMMAMDLYVSVNVGAVTGLAGLEAASGGIPMIALQALDQRRRDPQDWIWSDSDPAEVGDEAVRLLASADERKALGERQHAYVRANLSAEAMVAAYDRLYARAGVTG